MTEPPPKKQRTGVSRLRSSELRKSLYDAADIWQASLEEYGETKGPGVAKIAVLHHGMKTLDSTLANGLSELLEGLSPIVMTSAQENIAESARKSVDMLDAIASNMHNVVTSVDVLNGVLNDRLKRPRK